MYMQSNNFILSPWQLHWISALISKLYPGVPRSSVRLRAQGGKWAHSSPVLSYHLFVFCDFSSSQCSRCFCCFKMRCDGSSDCARNNWNKLNITCRSEQNGRVLHLQRVVPTFTCTCIPIFVRLIRILWLAASSENRFKFVAVAGTKIHVWAIIGHVAMLVVARSL